MSNDHVHPVFASILNAHKHRTPAGPHGLNPVSTYPMNSWFWAVTQGNPGDCKVVALAAVWSGHKYGLEEFDQCDFPDRPRIDRDSLIGWTHDLATARAAQIAYLIDQGAADDEDDARAQIAEFGE